MRSLSPSFTRTCTRTVSPGCIRGRSTSCAFSTISIAVMTTDSLRLLRARACGLPLAQPTPFLVVEHGRLHQVGPPLEGPLQRLLPAPSANFAVMSRGQNLGHAHSREFRGARVVRV